jgi:hypothetical protein
MPSQMPIGNTWEPNPWPIGGPMDQDTMLWNLRQQLDRDQGGDTLFHWSFITQKYASQAYTLGSIGRFIHPTYGLIRAMFCMFNQMNPALWTGSPVGFLQGDFTWEVTNVYASSAPNQCAGLQGSYVPMANGDCGWVIHQGVNLQSLPVTNKAPTFGVPLTWNANGTAAAGTPSSTDDINPIGCCMNPAAFSGGELAPGSIRVSVR